MDEGVQWLHERMTRRNDTEVSLEHFGNCNTNANPREIFLCVLINETCSDDGWDTGNYLEAHQEPQGNFLLYCGVDVPKQNYRKGRRPHR